MGHNNTWSKKMRSLDRQGVVLVANVEEWVGQPVRFAPDKACDRDPWTLADDPSGEVRFNGQEIKPLERGGRYVYKENAGVGNPS